MGQTIAYSAMGTPYVLRHTAMGAVTHTFLLPLLGGLNAALPRSVGSAIRSDGSSPLARKPDHYMERHMVAFIA